MKLSSVKKLSKKIWNWLKYIIAIIPFIWIYFHINIHSMLVACQKMAHWTLPLYTVVILLSMILQGVRWWMLTRAFIPTLSLKKIMSCHFAGLFYSIVIPGNASQDIVRAVMVSKENDYAIIWGATWISRLLGLIALAVLALWGLFAIDQKLLPSGFLPSMISAFIVLFVLLLLSFSKRTTSPIRLFVSKFIPQKFLTIIENIRQAIYLYKSQLGTVFIVGIVTLIMQLILIFAACIAIYGITGKLFIYECIAFTPIIELLCIAIPITPNGLGIRESLLGLMFLHLGLSPEQLGVYILFSFYSISMKLLGGIPILLGFTKPSLR